MHHISDEVIFIESVIWLRIASVENWKLCVRLIAYEESLRKFKINLRTLFQLRFWFGVQSWAQIAKRESCENIDHLRNILFV
jgi:hypothetical protein